MIGRSRSRRSLTPPHLLLLLHKGPTIHVWGGESGGGISLKTRMDTSSSSSCRRYLKQVFLGTLGHVTHIVASNQFVFNSIQFISFTLTSTLNLAKTQYFPLYVCITSYLYIQVSQHLMHSAFSLCCLLAVCGVIGARTIRRLCDTMPTCMQYACVCVIAVATYMYLKGVLATLHI